MKTIVFDVDGVLANFTRGFTQIANRMFGVPVVENDDQPSWDFKETLSAKQQDKIWEELKSIPGWAHSLEALIPYKTFCRINQLALKNELYFVTNRFSYMRPPGEQTVTWLMLHGISSPRVIVSAKKGEICQAIGADYCLEDNWGNAVSVHWMAEKCRSFLIERRYNEEARKIIPSGIVRVKTVEEYLDHIEEGS